MLLLDRKSRIYLFRRWLTRRIRKRWNLFSCEGDKTKTYGQKSFLDSSTALTVSQVDYLVVLSLNISVIVGVYLGFVKNMCITCMWIVYVHMYIYYYLVILINLLIILTYNTERLMLWSYVNFSFIQIIVVLS